MYLVSTISTVDDYTSKFYVTFAETTIETTVTKWSSTASEWVEQVTAQYYGRRPTVVGLDVEWRPQFIRNQMRNKVATLQLCINDSCLILQLLYMGEIPESIRQFLMNPNFTFVGVGVDEDVSKLRSDYGLDCNRTMDLGAEAVSLLPGCFRSRWPGLQELAREVCGLRMEKPRNVTLSNWEAFRLSDAQVEYGCIDAYASFKIGEGLLSYY